MKQRVAHAQSLPQLTAAYGPGAHRAGPKSRRRKQKGKGEGKGVDFYKLDASSSWLPSTCNTDSCGGSFIPRGRNFLNEALTSEDSTQLAKRHVKRGQQLEKQAPRAVNSTKWIGEEAVRIQHRARRMIIQNAPLLAFKWRHTISVWVACKCRSAWARWLAGTCIERHKDAEIDAMASSNQSRREEQSTSKAISFALAGNNEEAITPHTSAAVPVETEGCDDISSSDGVGNGDSIENGNSNTKSMHHTYNRAAAVSAVALQCMVRCWIARARVRLRQAALTRLQTHWRPLVEFPS